MRVALRRGSRLATEICAESGMRHAVAHYNPESCLRGANDLLA